MPLSQPPQAATLPTTVDGRREGACFIVNDRTGKLSPSTIARTLAARDAAKLLTRDEARRIAANMVKLPELLGAEPKLDANPLFHRRPT